MKKEVGVSEELREEVGVSEELREEVGVSEELREEVGVSEELREEVGVSEELMEEVGVSEELREEVGVSEELREEVGVSESFRRKLVRTQLKWAGHVERMERERLTKRAGALRVQGKRRRGRPRLRWEDCEERFGGIGWGVENASEGWGEETPVKQDQ